MESEDNAFPLPRAWFSRGIAPSFASARKVYQEQTISMTMYSPEVNPFTDESTLEWPISPAPITILMRSWRSSSRLTHTFSVMSRQSVHFFIDDTLDGLNLDIYVIDVIVVFSTSDLTDNEHIWIWIKLEHCFRAIRLLSRSASMTSWSASPSEYRWTPVWRVSASLSIVCLLIAAIFTFPRNVFKMIFWAFGTSMKYSEYAGRVSSYPGDNSIAKYMSIVRSIRNIGSRVSLDVSRSSSEIPIGGYIELGEDFPRSGPLSHLLNSWNFNFWPVVRSSTVLTSDSSSLQHLCLARAAIRRRGTILKHHVWQTVSERHSFTTRTSSLRFYFVHIYSCALCFIFPILCYAEDSSDSWSSSSLELLARAA